MKIKPFPWICFGCRQREVYMTTVDYHSTIDLDGRSYEIHVPGLDMPQCRACGTRVRITDAGEKIEDAIRRAVGVQTPEQLRAGRESTGLTAAQMAAMLNVDEWQIERWESGGQIQTRLQDRFLRAFFAVPQLREYLARLPTEPQVIRQPITLPGGEYDPQPVAQAQVPGEGS